MQSGRGGRDDFFGFGDPSGGSGGPFGGARGPFGGPGSLLGGFGGFGGPGSMMTNFFGGRNPFDDPFFTQPFGGMMMGPSMFGQSMFGSDRSFFGQPSSGGFIDQQQAPPSRSRGPIIEELPYDGEEAEEGGKWDVGKIDNPRKHPRSSKGMYVEDPEEEAEEKKTRHIQHSNDFNRAGRVMPQTRSYSFHSSTVTYGGPDGAYRTSSKTRRTAGDGLTMEESKEADTTTGRASHRISRGLRDKMSCLGLRKHGKGMQVSTYPAGTKYWILTVMVAKVGEPNHQLGVGPFLQQSSHMTRGGGHSPDRSHFHTELDHL